MPWSCFLVEAVKVDPPVPIPQKPGVLATVMYRLQNGEMVHHDDLDIGATYTDLHGERHVVIPFNDRFTTTFNIDASTSCETGNRWRCTGIAPEFTIHPSINFVGHYHGWVSGGIVSDDLEGRKYAFVGKR